MAAKIKFALRRGYKFQGYRIDGVLGAGAFGITYRAREADLARWVAIKEYFPKELAARDANRVDVNPIDKGVSGTYSFSVKAFRDEAKILVNFNHPNIVHVYRYFMANGTAYLVMPLIKGENLLTRLDRDKRLTEHEIDAILRPLLDAMEHVHEAGFLHRDIKPSNIIIREDGVPVLIDFGAARQAVRLRRAEAGSPVTPGYSPLEQYSRKGKIGPWTDIYALGATLYHMISGKPPPDIFQRLDDDTMVPATRVGDGIYSSRLLRAIDQSLRMDPKARPQTVRDWAHTIERPSRPGQELTPSRSADGKEAHRPETVVATADQAKLARKAGRRPARLKIAAIIVFALLAATGIVYGPGLLKLEPADRIAQARGDLIGTWCYQRTKYIQVRIWPKSLRTYNSLLDRSSNARAFKILGVKGDEVIIEVNAGETLGRPNSTTINIRRVRDRTKTIQRLWWAPKKTIIAGHEVKSGDPEFLVPCDP